ncbi:hypothetical protein PORCRE_1297 [Porphyromonas crevioricanis JCM 15906]|uniref:Uncharacterized protein n=1 Tax=Porphyromonas crevioricanis JCM 15906 TaxID=1305617 RepID=T1CP18_9PORP|nr:hypothetical protein PORCRE_1297 [Porphyromonas crevioricanis JCM 15906]
MVRLRVINSPQKFYFPQSFNSNMVRLRERCSTLLASEICRFNSNMVRLRVGSRPFGVVQPFCVSIPIWCD